MAREAILLLSLHVWLVGTLGSHADAHAVLPTHLHHDGELRDLASSPGLTLEIVAQKHNLLNSRNLSRDSLVLPSPQG